MVLAPLLLECERVLTRAERLAASSALVEVVAAVLHDVAASAEWVRLDYLWRPQLRDADDEVVVETAVNGRADILATFNLGDLAAAAARFGVRALRPINLLRLAET